MPGSKLAGALGFTRTKTPSVGTLHTVLRRLDKQALEAALGRWAEAVVAALPAVEADQEQTEALAIDGKCLRGSRRQQAAGVHLLSALSHRLGVTLGQVALDKKTNAISAIHPLLEGLLLEGKLVTVDALLTQKQIAGAIRSKGGTT
jgi:hypothetical protein